MARNRVQFRSFLRNVNQAMEEAEERALLKVGIFVQGEAQDRSPVQTGNLRDSNGYRVEEKKVIVGNNAEYAIHVHEGTNRQQPQRFLQDAAEQNATRVREIISGELESL
jgi:HK97 gp10 family phage protein